MNNDELPASVTEPLRTDGAARDCQRCFKPIARGQTVCGWCGLSAPEASAEIEWARKTAREALERGPYKFAVPPVRTYSEADEVADSLKYIAETAHNAGVTKTYAALSGEFQKVTGKAAECGECGVPILRTSVTRLFPTGWVHDFKSNGAWEKVRVAGCGRHAAPAATPEPIVISSPAHFLPELKSDADHFAEEYRLQHDLPFSMLTHLAWAWLMGKQDERLKGGK